jgi:hypothetical protein
MSPYHLVVLDGERVPGRCLSCVKAVQTDGAARWYVTHHQFFAHCRSLFGVAREMCRSRSGRVDTRDHGAPKATVNLAPFTGAIDQEFRWITGGGDRNGENDAANTTDSFVVLFRAPYALPGKAATHCLSTGRSTSLSQSPPKETLVYRISRTSGVESTWRISSVASIPYSIPSHHLSPQLTIGQPKPLLTDIGEANNGIHSCFIVDLER